MSKHAYHPRELIDRIVAKWNEHECTASELALHFSMTRNQIIGIVNRNGGERREATNASGRTRATLSPEERERIKKEKEEFARKRAEQRLAQQKAFEAGEPEPIGPLNDFPPKNTCRYTNDDPLLPPYRFCGHPVHKHTSWCEWHYKRYFEQAAERGRQRNYEYKPVKRAW